MNRVSVRILLFLSCLYPLLAQAQISIPIPAPMNVGPSLDALWDEKKNPRRDIAPRYGVNGQGLSHTKVYEIVRSRYKYTPSSSRTKANLQSFVNKTRANDPASAAEIEQLFASTDIIGQAGAVMRSAGLNKNNVADAFAVYWINAWSAAYADFTPTSRKMAQSVARQAAAGLSQSPEFANATNAQKQEIAEALLVQAAMIEGAARAAQSDAATLRKVGQAVMQGAKATGLDLDKMTLTENGFVKANKGSDAGEAVDATGPTATDKALASADGAAANDNGSEDDGLSTAQLALIAGAAGAGIAGVFLLGRSMGNKG